MKSRMFLVVATTIIALQTVGVIPVVVPALTDTYSQLGHSTDVYAEDLGGMTQEEYDAYMAGFYNPEPTTSDPEDIGGMTSEEYDAYMAQFDPEPTTSDPEDIGGMTPEEYDAYMAQFNPEPESTTNEPEDLGGMTQAEYDAYMAGFYGP